MAHDQPAAVDLATVVDLLVARDKAGLVWLDQNFIVTRTHGALAAAAIVGDHVTDGLVALVGQEKRIAALRAEPNAMLELPNVAVVVDDAPPVRVDLTVMSFGATGFVVVIERVVSSGLAELMVEDEIRKRRIADAELARINRQLEEFAYVISHDLKAPMRALRYYSGDVTEALATEPPDLEGARVGADNIRSATQRMSSMLLGLLEYSRVGRQTEPLDDIDTRDLVDNITRTMPARDGLRLTVGGDWPRMRAARTPLDLVLRNLIDNAIKYHDRDTGKIHVIARASGDGLVIDVEDDGPGIPAEWHEAIFEPFKRIDDDAHPESSGLGLALVKRTLETEGGRIEVFSDAPARRGTTFRVTWPRR